MPRSSKNTEDDNSDAKMVVRRVTRATAMPSVTDSPLRRSSRHRQPVQVDNSSPESIVSELSGPTTKTRTLRPRNTSVTSDISELGDDILSDRRVTRRSSATTNVVHDTPTKTRLRRGVRAGSETKTMSPSVRVTRLSRAGSVDGDRVEALKALELPGSNHGTPVKRTTRRTSVQPSEPSVIEEPKINTVTSESNYDYDSDDTVILPGKSTSPNVSIVLEASEDADTEIESTEKINNASSGSRKSMKRKSLKKTEDHSDSSRKSLASLQDDNINSSQNSLESKNNENSSCKLNDPSTENTDNVSTCSRKSMGRKSLKKIEESTNLSESSSEPNNDKNSSCKLDDPLSIVIDIDDDDVDVDAPMEDKNNDDDVVLNVPASPVTCKSPEKTSDVSICSRKSLGRKSLKKSEESSDNSRKSLASSQDDNINSSESLSKQNNDKNSSCKLNNSSSIEITIDDDDVDVPMENKNVMDELEKTVSLTSPDKSCDNLNTSRKSINRKSLNKSEDSLNNSQKSVAGLADDLNVSKNLLEENKVDENKTLDSVDQKKSSQSPEKTPKKLNTRVTSSLGADTPGPLSSKKSRRQMNSSTTSIESFDATIIGTPEKNSRKSLNTSKDSTPKLNSSFKEPKTPKNVVLDVTTSPVTCESTENTDDVSSQNSLESNNDKNSSCKLDEPTPMDVDDDVDAPMEDQNNDDNVVLNVTASPVKSKSPEKSSDISTCSRKSLGRKSLNKTEDRLNNSRKSLASSQDDINSSQNSLESNKDENSSCKLDDSSTEKSTDVSTCSRKSLGRKSLNKTEDRLNNSRKSLASSQDDINVSQNSLESTIDKNSSCKLDDLSTDNTGDVSMTSRKSLGRKSLKKTEDRLNNSRKSLASSQDDINVSQNSLESTIDKNSSCKSDDSSTDNTGDVSMSSRKSLGRKSLNKTENRSNNSRKSLASSQDDINSSKNSPCKLDVSSPEPKKAKSPNKSLNGSIKFISTTDSSDEDVHVVPALLFNGASDDDNEDVDDDEDDEDEDDEVKKGAEDENDNDDEEEDEEDDDDDDDDDEEKDDEDSNSINSDIENEYNLNGDTSLKYSDDDVQADNCLETDEESSDSDGESLVDFIVDDDEDEEDEEDEEEDDSDDDNDDDDDDDDDDEIGERSTIIIQKFEDEDDESNGVVIEEIANEEESLDTSKSDEDNKHKDNKLVKKINSNESQKNILCRTISVDSSTPKSTSSDREINTPPSSSSKKQKHNLIMKTNVPHVDTPRPPPKQNNISVVSSSDNSPGPMSSKKSKKNLDISSDNSPGPLSSKKSLQSPEKTPKKLNTSVTSSSGVDSPGPASSKKSKKQLNSSTTSIESSDPAVIDTPDKKSKKSLNITKDSTPKSNGSFKESTTPKSLLQTSIMKSIEKTKPTTELGLNCTLLPKPTESPSIRTLMKEKLNDTLPAIKLASSKKRASIEADNATIKKRKLSTSIDENEDVEAPEVLALSKARKQIEEELAKQKQSIVADKDSKKRKRSKAKSNNNNIPTNEPVKTTTSAGVFGVETAVKRLPIDFLESLSETDKRPIKKRKIEGKTMPTRCMFASPSHVPKNMFIENEYKPLKLTTSGGTTDFAVVNLKKNNRTTNNTSEGLSYRERMLGRNKRQPISAYFMHQKKLKALNDTNFQKKK